MWNLVKANSYAIRKHHFFPMIISMCLLGPLLIFLIMGLYEKIGEYSVSAYFPDLIMIYFFFLIMSTTMFVGLIGEEQNNKVLNYEILYGHQREYIYLSRVIVIAIWTLINAVIVIVPSLVGFLLFFDWGVSGDFKYAMLRILFLVVQSIKYSCFMISLLFWFKNKQTAMAAGSVVTGMITMGYMFLSIMDNELTEFANKYLVHIFSLVGCLNLIGIGNYELGFEGGKDIPIYDFSFTNGYAVTMILSAIVMIAIYIFAGLKIYKKQDVN